MVQDIVFPDLLRCWLLPPPHSHSQSASFFPNIHAFFRDSVVVPHRSLGPKT